ncbi:hypothetical protein DM860_004140 [Cuscuta australis]|uniref:Uncharacterized protein n=1 Tax=Cuscuta australis TaxID=267555 RepID=A0A328CXR0_9ASTE|nr:hypothetical protein DM860_004140 [Cuscuta australis]
MVHVKMVKKTIRLLSIFFVLLAELGYGFVTKPDCFGKIGFLHGGTGSIGGGIGDGAPTPAPTPAPAEGGAPPIADVIPGFDNIPIPGIGGGRLFRGGGIGGGGGGIGARVSGGQIGKADIAGGRSNGEFSKGTAALEMEEKKG